MKKLIISLFALLIANLSLRGQQIIANHTVVDQYDKIPAYYMNLVKKMRVNIPGESHSSGYRKGMTLLMQENAAYKVVVTETRPPAPYQEDSLRIDRFVRNQYNNWNEGIGEAGWYAWHAWAPAAANYPTIAANQIKKHITYSNRNNLAIAAIGFGWCWDMTWHNNPSGTVDPDFGVRWGGSSEGGPDGDRGWGLNNADTALVHNRVTMDDYLQATQEYIKLIQDSGFTTKVLFTTGPVDGNSNSENGYQREIKHTYIRDYVLADPTRILFDYADILCWSNAGEQNLNTWSGHQFPQIHADNMKDLDGTYAEDGDHIGQRGTVRLAKAMWWLLARIAGWDGNTGSSDTEAPTAPTGLTAHDTTSTSVRLTWDASTDNIGVLGYFIYSGTDSLAMVSGLEYTISGLTSSTNYSFSVKAKDAAGNKSASSNVVQVSTLPETNPVGMKQKQYNKQLLKVIPDLKRHQIYMVLPEQEMETVQVDIFDISGKRIYTKSIKPINEHILIDNLTMESGIYIISVSNKKSVYTAKLRN